MSKIYRFFINNIKLQSLNIKISEKEEPEVVYQLNKVLRCKIGDQLVLLNDGSYDEFHYEILEVGKRDLTLTFLKKKKLPKPNLPALELALCLPNRPGKLEFIVEKAVELGVSKITLLRSQYSNFGHQIKLERLQKIVKEAAEQSERSFIPEIIIEKSFENYLKANKESISTAMERSPEILSILEFTPKKSTQIVLIGPEGGFSLKEKELISELKISSFSLGESILRMETAAILALGLFNLKIN